MPFESLALRRREFMGASVGSLVLAAMGLSRAAHAQASGSGWVKLPTEHYKGKQDDVFFLDPNTGWYGNGAGRVFKTIDGGLSWTKLLDQPGTYVRAIGFIDEQVGFIGNIGTGYFPGVTDPQPLYRTTDGGQTWEAVKPIAGPVPVGICAIDIQKIPFINAGRLDERVIVRAGGRVGSPAFLAESRDRGKTWTSRDMAAHTAMILDVKFVSEKVGFIAGAAAANVQQSNALILRTIDGGRTWHRVYKSSRPWEVTWKLAFPSRAVGYATIQNYNPDKSIVGRVVAKTIDGGRTWHEMHLADDHAVTEFGIAFLDERHGWVGATTTGFETLDGGRNWARVDMGKAVNKIRVVREPGGGAVAYAIGSDLYKLELPKGGKSTG